MTQLSPEEFDEIKQQLAEGETVVSIAHAYGRGSNTIEFVNKANTFSEYKQLQFNYYLKYRKGDKPVSGQTRNQPRNLNNKVSRGDSVTPEEFEFIKMLQNNGVIPSMVGKVSRRSPGTVYSISRVETYEAWRKAQAEYELQKKLALEKKAPSMETILHHGVDIPVAQVNGTDPALLEALNNLALAFNHFSTKLDEVIETKRPWLGKELNR